MPESERRIATWSGPRNISTALLRAWESRPDTFVCDEPLYAHYLRETGALHPGRDEVIASQDGDARAVVAWLTGPIPRGRAIFYQKHMAHHLLPSVERGWLERVDHAFLIRDPREMLLSLAAVMRAPTLVDTGLPQQVELFDAVRARSGRVPPVLDAQDVLREPEGHLRALCAALEVEFLPAMLAWAPGRRDTDGVWAKHWYASVERSTGFEPWRPRHGELSPDLEGVLDACREPYAHLFEHRLRA